MAYSPRMGSTLQDAAGLMTPLAERERRWFFGAVGAAPVLMLLAPDYLTTIGLVALVTSTVVAWSVADTKVQSAPLDRLFVVGVVFFVTALLSSVANPGGFDGFIALSRFLIVPLGFVAVRGGARHDLRGAIWLGSVVGSIGAGVVALSLVVFVDMDRPTSFVNPIHFGELALVLGFVATLTRGITPWDRRLVRRLTLVAIAGAVSASILAQARGSWVALPAILVVAFVHYRRSGGRRTVRYTVALVVVLVPVMMIAATMNDRAAVRAFDRGVEQTLEYVVMDGAERTGETSVGARFEMWRSAVAGFRASPFLGVGWGNINERFVEDVHAGVRAERIANYGHPHNQYVSHLSSGGLVGLGGLLALFAVPGWIFFGAFRSRRADVRALGAAGLVVLAGFAVFAMTDSVLESASPLIFFVLMIGIFASQIDRLESEHTFAYGEQGGMEQSGSSMEGDRTGTL